MQDFANDLRDELPQVLPAPGETHVFGLEIVKTFFQKASWSVEESGDGESRFAIRCGWFEIVGFPISCHRLLEKVADTILLARANSINWEITVLVGAPLIAPDTGLARSVKANLGVADARQAVIVTRGLLKRHPNP